MIVKLRMVTIYSNGASNILLVFKIHELLVILLQNVRKV